MHGGPNEHGNGSASSECGGADDAPAAADDPGPSRQPHEPPPRDVRVIVDDATGRLTHDRVAWLEATGAACVAAALRRAGVDPPRGEARVRVIGAAEMAILHERHAGVSGATDVLTFDLCDGDALDADIAVCLDVASDHAAERGIAVERELLLYLLHGSLHCLGHDDHGDDASAAMHAEEDAILAEVGVGATYAEPDRSPAPAPVVRTTPADRIGARESVS